MRELTNEGEDPLNGAPIAPSPGSPAEAAIALAGLRFRWPAQAHDVLDIAALEIARGERVFVHGPSGSGKTTLLSLIGAVLEPDAGEVHVDGVALGSLSRGARDTFRAERIGFVFQMFNLLPFLGLIDNVLLPCRFSARRRARAAGEGGTAEGEARRLLGALGLDVAALERRPVVELSVGQQQRVAAARALIGRPPVVVADEPTSALDADTREGFLELLFGEVATAGATLLFVSHDRALEPLFGRTIDLAAVNRAAVPA